MNLALFDFDGTITNQDAFTEFLYFATPKSRLIIGGIIASPVVALYKLGWLPARITRPILSRIAYGYRRCDELDAIAQRFVDHYLPSVIRPEAQQQLEWHKRNGDEIYVVSASLSPYLNIWCQQQGIKLVCSQLAIKHNRYSGAYVDGDCSLENKVRLLKQSLAQQGQTLESFRHIYAYGDTYEDVPMLELAEHKFFAWQPITTTGDIERLIKPHR